MEKSCPKISVVIPSFNQGSFIEETILSIINQNYPKTELIIIDGGSSDNTIQIIKKYSDSINYFVSEKDNGQAHALNKGFSIASGDICSYLNSDDLYLENIFWKISQLYLKDNFKWVASNVLIGTSVDKSEIWEAKITSYQLFCAEQTIGQQGTFWENNCLKKPWFDEDLQYVMDHKFFINLYQNFGRPKYLNFTGSFFRIHNNSKTSRLEEILFKERKIITSEAIRLANNKFQKRNIKLEMKRLDLKVEINKEFLIMSKKSKLKYKVLSFFSILLIFLKTPFKFRDKFFLGYIKRSLNLLR